MAAARSGTWPSSYSWPAPACPVPASSLPRAQLILQAAGSSESQRKFERDIQKRLIDIITREKDEKVGQSKLATALKEIRAAMSDSDRKALADNPGGLSEAALDAFNNAWFRFFLTYDPRPALRRVRCPVLAINGAKDLQVPAKENLAEIEKALAHAVATGRSRRSNCRGSTTSLSALQDRPREASTARSETTIAPEALKTIGDWIIGQTGTSSSGPRRTER